MSEPGALTRQRRVVLDNCVPRAIVRHLAPLAVRHVRDFGWDDVDDGPLLDLLAPVCDVFVTVDRNLPFQQRLAHRPFATIVLLARSNRLEHLFGCVAGLVAVVPRLAAGTVTRLEC